MRIGPVDAVVLTAAPVACGAGTPGNGVTTYRCTGPDFAVTGTTSIGRVLV